MYKFKKGFPQFALCILFSVLCIVIVTPFILLISISISNEKDIVLYGYSFIPRTIDFSSYKFIFKEPQSILNAYKVTILSTIIGTGLSVLLMSMIAFPLSKKNLKGKRFISFFLFFTMLFNGGLVPTYILITQYLKLGDSFWVLVIPGLINVWHVFMIRVFFAGIPSAVVESAEIDGASEYRILFYIIMPLSKPVLATVALLGTLARWNDWYTVMLYINKESLFTLQYLLQRILLNIQLLQNNSFIMGKGMELMDLPSETARMAMAIVAAGPMLLVFPFFQKYFVKGFTVGSVKG